MPLTMPEPRYFSIPSRVVGGAERRKAALNWRPWTRSLTQVPLAWTNSPAPIAAAAPTRVTRSRWPRAFTRRTQKPVSGLWNVTRSTSPASASRSGGAAPVAAPVELAPATEPWRSWRPARSVAVPSGSVGEVRIGMPARDGPRPCAAQRAGTAARLPRVPGTGDRRRRSATAAGQAGAGRLRAVPARASLEGGTGRRPPTRADTRRWQARHRPRPARSPSGPPPSPTPGRSRRCARRLRPDRPQPDPGPALRLPARGAPGRPGALDGRGLPRALRRGPGRARARAASRGGVRARRRARAGVAAGPRLDPR